jgi:4-amino-4-deoxy-L-arabinose transferase-like glycosyltransferase
MIRLSDALRDPTLGILLGGAFLIRLIAVPAIHQLGYTSDEREYVLLAGRILDGTGFIDSNGTQSVRAPLYPAFLAGALYLDGGEYSLGHVLGALLGALGVSLVFLLGFAVYGERKTALWGAAMAAFYPGLITYSAMLQTETLFIVFFLLTLILAWSFLSQPRLSTSLQLGLCAGLAGLTRAVFVPFFPFLLLVLLLSRVARGWAKARCILAAALVFIIVLLPWGIRNYLIHQRLVPVSTFAGPSLLLGNNPFTTGTTRLQDGFDAWFSESVGARTGHFPDELSEIQRADLSRDIALDFISTHPGRFAELLIRKAHVLLVYPITNSDSYIPAQLVAVLADGLLLLAAAMGVVLAPGGRRGLVALLAICAFFAVTHIVLHAEARYRLPLVPLLCIVAGAGAAAVTSAPGRQTLREEKGSAARLTLLWTFIVALYGVTGLMFLRGSIK